MDPFTEHSSQSSGLPSTAWHISAPPTSSSSNAEGTFNSASSPSPLNKNTKDGSVCKWRGRAENNKDDHNGTQRQVARGYSKGRRLKWSLEAQETLQCLTNYITKNVSPRLFSTQGFWEMEGHYNGFFMCPPQKVCTQKSSSPFAII